MPDQNIVPARGEREGSRGVRNFLLGTGILKKTSFSVVSDRAESGVLLGWHILSTLRTVFFWFLGEQSLQQKCGVNENQKKTKQPPLIAGKKMINCIFPI